MSKKWTVLFAGMVASLAFAAGTMQGCGGGGSGNNYQSLCNQVCDKVAACAADAGAPSDPAACKQTCTTMANQHCTNESAIASAVQKCVDMQDCTAAETCVATIPGCQTSTGTGGSGTGGSGGSTGTGGGGGTSGGGWSCEDQPAQGNNPAVCVCLQAAGGTLTTCPSSETCCFTSNLGGTASCSCTTPPQGVTCAQLVAAAGGAMVSHCPQ